MRVGTGGADARNERDVGDQAVHCTEHRGAQPSTGNVGVDMSYLGRTSEGKWGLSHGRILISRGMDRNEGKALLSPRQGWHRGQAEPFLKEVKNAQTRLPSLPFKAEASPIVTGPPPEP